MRWALVLALTSRCACQPQPVRGTQVRAPHVGVDPMTLLGVWLGSSGNGSWFVRDVSVALP